MPGLESLLRQNRSWSEGVRLADPQYFERLSSLQTPEYLWIGCSDSRVPANQVLGLAPGEVFVHRNIANVVAHSDFNSLSVLEYAVAVLKVKHVIVCGHYGCGGVKGALTDHHLGLIDNWLRHIRDVRQKHIEELSAIEDETERLDRLCELNVADQVSHVCQTTIVQHAWKRGQSLSVHGWIYGLRDGLLKDLQVSASSIGDVAEAYRINGVKVAAAATAAIPA
ncbi:MAG: carbonate dehydratase [Planctomycetaceae bacterium]|nr:carbonate dehydratase [Planctomycetaceae bacterium]